MTTTRDIIYDSQRLSGLEEILRSLQLSVQQMNYTNYEQVNQDNSDNIEFIISDLSKIEEEMADTRTKVETRFDMQEAKIEILEESNRDLLQRAQQFEEYVRNKFAMMEKLVAASTSGFVQEVEKCESRMDNYLKEMVKPIDANLKCVQSHTVSLNDKMEHMEKSLTQKIIECQEAGAASNTALLLRMENNQDHTDESLGRQDNRIEDLHARFTQKHVLKERVVLSSNRQENQQENRKENLSPDQEVISALHAKLKTIGDKVLLLDQDKRLNGFFQVVEESEQKNISTHQCCSDRKSVV